MGPVPHAGRLTSSAPGRKTGASSFCRRCTTEPVTAEQLLLVVKRYEAELEMPARRQDPRLKQPTTVDVLGHARWMCSQIPGLVAEGRIEKAQRWLGFVQGVLWASGRKTIESLKEDNR